MTTPKEYQRRQYMRRCIHYTGAWDATHCAAGVEYETMLDRSQHPWRRACYDPTVPITCDKRELPTEAQFEAKFKQEEEALSRALAIRSAILATGLPQGGIDCPCCDGRVGFSVASNGHVAAACSTKGCAKWVE